MVSNLEAGVGQRPAGVRIGLEAPPRDEEGLPDACWANSLMSSGMATCGPSSRVDEAVTGRGADLRW